jgi:hypothetical protein
MNILPMTEQQYVAFVGSAPTDDDLERVNCKDAGKIGHRLCGWNYCFNLPKFAISQHKTGCKCKQ